MKSFREVFYPVSRYIYAFKAILSGLIIAHILSVWNVYLSNMELYHSLKALAKAGYLIVPNMQVMETLTSFRAAFFGGFFFTLTVGAALCLLSFASAWVWDRILRRNPHFFIPFLAFWMWCVISVNSEGLSRINTIYFLLIPAVVFGLGVMRIPKPSENTRLKLVIHIICFGALATMGYSQTSNTNIFIKIRDNLLLSNPVGMKLNTFYYDYTLYAARVFKAKKQRLIRTCSLALIDDEALLRRMEKILTEYDYLPVERGNPTDLDIVRRGDILDFKVRFWTLLQRPIHEFLRYPGDVLKKFSGASDKHAFFRSFTSFSILVVLSITLYFGIYGMFRILAGLFLEPAQAISAGGLLCLLTGMLFLAPHYFEEEKKYIGMEELARRLASDDSDLRISAISNIRERELDISRFPAYHRSITSPCVAERYWLARTFSLSRSPDTYQALLRLLDDPNFNVVYSAFHALGERREKKAVGEILRRIKVSDNWYVQWYAYKALRKLGWKQTKSE